MLCVHRFKLECRVGNEVRLDDMADSPKIASSASDRLPQCPRCAIRRLQRNHYHHKSPDTERSAGPVGNAIITVREVSSRTGACLNAGLFTNSSLTVSFKPWLQTTGTPTAFPKSTVLDVAKKCNWRGEQAT